MKIICVGRNYQAHAAELGNKVPTKPLLFIKPPTALLLNNRDFFIPEFTSDVHYELELVLKICKNGKSVQPEFAHKYYEQIALGIDFTARDIQTKCKKKGHPWEIAKGFDFSAALSKFVPISSLKNPHNIQFQMKKNGIIVQDGQSEHMIFNFNYLICYISQFFKLQMGDYIFTGTPAGVGPVAKTDKLEGYLEGNKLIDCSIR